MHLVFKLYEQKRSVRDIFSSEVRARLESHLTNDNIYLQN